MTKLSQLPAATSVTPATDSLMINTSDGAGGITQKQTTINSMLLAARIAVGEIALTYASNIAVDASTGQNFTVTMTGNATLANPTNLTAGQKFKFRVVQDNSGNRTLAYGSVWKWRGGTVGVLSTAANATDIIDAYTDGTYMYAKIDQAFS